MNNESNPYQSPQSVAVPRTEPQPTDSPHRSFRLTVDENNPYFVVGNIRSAIRFAVLQIGFWLLITSMIMDGGLVFAKAVLAAICFSGLIALHMIIFRNRQSENDILLVKWGYIPVFLIVANVQNFYEVVTAGN